MLALARNIPEVVTLILQLVTEVKVIVEAAEEAEAEAEDEDVDITHPTMDSVEILVNPAPVTEILVVILGMEVLVKDILAAQVMIIVPTLEVVEVVEDEDVGTTAEAMATLEVDLPTMVSVEILAEIPVPVREILAVILGMEVLVTTTQMHHEEVGVTVEAVGEEVVASKTTTATIIPTAKTGNWHDFT